MGRKKNEINQPFNEEEEPTGVLASPHTGNSDGTGKLFCFTIDHDDDVGLALVLAVEKYLAKHSKKTIKRCKKKLFQVPVLIEDLLTKSEIAEKFP